MLEVRVTELGERGLETLPIGADYKVQFKGLLEWMLSRDPFQRAVPCPAFGDASLSFGVLSEIIDGCRIRVMFEVSKGVVSIWSVSLGELPEDEVI